MNVESTDAAGGAVERSLARDMLDVHGLRAAVVARDNARAAALAGQRPQAKSWVRVLGLIQQSGADREERRGGTQCEPRQAQLKDDGNVYFSDDEPRFQELLEEPSVNQ